MCKEYHTIVTMISDMLIVMLIIMLDKAVQKWWIWNMLLEWL